MLSEKIDVIENGRGEWLFSDEIELSFDIEGIGVRHYLASKSKYANKNPRVMTVSAKDRRHMDKKRRQDVGYYVNSDGSFACMPSVINDRPQCNWRAVIHDEKQSCFIKGTDAYCKEKVVGEILVDSVPDDKENVEVNGTLYTITKPYPGNRTHSHATSSRQTRQIKEPTTNARVVQIAFYLDAAFMEKFYAVNPGNDGAAEEDAVMYINLIANEMTYRMVTVKDYRLRYRGGILELAVNPSIVIYPEKGQDLEFIEKDGIYLLEISRENFIEYFNTEPPKARVDHSMLITGLDMYKENTFYLGQAFRESVCSLDRVYRERRYSVNEDRGYDVMLTLAHELGHALGSDHDTDDDGPCSDGRYIMSSELFLPDESTKRSFNLFSACSVRQFRNHLAKWPDCLSKPTDENFRENFCKGPREFRESYFDYQCQVYYDYGPEYTECDGIDAVEPDGCWRTNAVSCYPGTGDQCFGLPYIADGSPCKGPNQDKDYYCYLGECVEEIEICPDGYTPSEEQCYCDNLISNFAYRACCLFARCC